MKKCSFKVFLFLIAFLSCSKGLDNNNKLFKKINSNSSNIHFSNQLNTTPELNILNYLYYYNGAGVAVADFNNDGLDDIYFTGNQVADELYINLGNLEFKKATKEAQLIENTHWSTGVTHVDINNDGLLDIYICKAAGYKNLKGKNLLYVNQGIDNNGIPKFKEEAKKYNLDFSGLSTQAAFFDYDLDGDLDMYLMNHSVHPNRTYGKGTNRKKIDPISGDILFENQNGYFKDVSQKAKIFQGKLGYGLGLSISDINNDGYPDIYIGNDFFENDYLYLNQQNGTFKELISTDNTKLGHTTHFSMGNAIEDINNDGNADILSLDMLPENLKTYKTSGLEYGYPIYKQYLKNGFAPQYMSNTLHLNMGDTNFSEISNLTGIAATEWSWGPLIADFDNDGLKDIYITNGIKGATNDMDYMNFIANEDIQRRIDAGMQKTDLPLINEIPEKKIANYFFKNKGGLRFENTTNTWSTKELSFSNGCSYSDLDNDGDLDIIVNNVNEEAYILENKTSNTNYLKISLKGDSTNLNGLGTVITAYTNSGLRRREHFATKGYLSAVSNTIHFGLGKDTIIDSLKIIWLNGKHETLKQVKTNQHLIASISNANKAILTTKTSKKIYTSIDSLINFKHKESAILDFDREPLIPFANSNQGPNITVTDFNKDGLDDFFITGAKKQASELFIQNKNGEFQSIQKETFEAKSINENTTSVFFDANKDGFIDLITASAGNEFKNGKQIQPSLFLNKNGSLIPDKEQFATIELNASKIDTIDIDNDGVLDIFISSDAVPGKFGATPKQYLFKNNGEGNFTDITDHYSPDLRNIGNVTDFIWKDINNNGFKDLILVGHWMPVSIFINNGHQLRLEKKESLKKTNGFWNSIKVEDFDNDGDLDFVCGNWGLNTKFKASHKKPIRLYREDFDNNGAVEPIVTYYHKNIETPFASKDELVKQIPNINKTFLSYKDFATASINDLFGKEKLKTASKKEVYELRSCYFKNDGNGNYIKTPLPLIVQSSSVFDFAVEDINNDGFKDLLIVGNNYDISTQLGRLDGLHGLILENDKKNNFIWRQDQNLNISGASRVIKSIKIKGEKHYIIGINDRAPILLRKN